MELSQAEKKSEKKECNSTVARAGSNLPHSCMFAGKPSPYGGADASHLAETCSSRRAGGVFSVRWAVRRGSDGKPRPHKQDGGGGRRAETPVGDEL